MKYRKNIKNGDMLSILGYGCMRLPAKGNVIDEEKAEKLIVKAIENGVNYFDTAYIYSGGNNEGFVGKVLAKGYRNRVKLATKLPQFMIRKKGDIDKIFDIQLKRLQTNYIDYYLIHMLTDVGTWERLKSMGIIEWIESKKKSGQIINIGFSYHGGKSEFVKLIDAYDWDFCQMQYNFLDENNQAGKSGLLYAASKGIPVIIMEPLRGGKIVTGLPKEVNEIWAKALPARSPADWALRWVWNHREAMVVLSGMGAEEILNDNIRIAMEAEADSLTNEELELFKRAKEILQKKTKVNCTGCGYCMPCPAGVDIPMCFSCYNDAYLIGSMYAKRNYAKNTGSFTRNPTYASLCKKCGKCEEHCPQGVPVREKLDEVVRKIEGPFYRPVLAIIKKIMKV